MSSRVVVVVVYNTLAAGAGWAHARRGLSAPHSGGAVPTTAARHERPAIHRRLRPNARPCSALYPIDLRAASSGGAKRLRSSRCSPSGPMAWGLALEARPRKCAAFCAALPKGRRGSARARLVALPKGRRRRAYLSASSHSASSNSGTISASSSGSISSSSAWKPRSRSWNGVEPISEVTLAVASREMRA